MLPKVSTLSSGKLNKNEQLIGKKVLPPQHHRIIQEAEFTYFPLENGLEKQTETIEKCDEK